MILHVTCTWPETPERITWPHVIQVSWPHMTCRLSWFTFESLHVPYGPLWELEPGPNEPTLWPDGDIKSSFLNFELDDLALLWGRGHEPKIHTHWRVNGQYIEKHRKAGWRWLRILLHSQRRRLEVSRILNSTIPRRLCKAKTPYCYLPRRQRLCEERVYGKPPALSSRSR